MSRWAAALLANTLAEHLATNSTRILLAHENRGAAATAAAAAAGTSSGRGASSTADDENLQIFRIAASAADLSVETLHREGTMSVLEVVRADV